MNLPLYKQIENELQEKIEAGIYQEGDLIPKEIDLAESYQVSRPTIRQAIQGLVDKGLLEKRKRRGTIVTANKIEQEFTHVIESYDVEMGKKGLTPTTQVLALKTEEAYDDVADYLNLAEGEAVYKLVRLRFVNDVPIVFVTTYIPVKLFPDLLEQNFVRGKLYDYFGHAGHGIQRVSRKLEVIKADETISDLLDISEDDPIFYFHTTGFNAHNQAIEYSISKYRGDINYFMFEINNGK